MIAVPNKGRIPPINANKVKNKALGTEKIKIQAL